MENRFKDKCTTRYININILTSIHNRLSENSSNIYISQKNMPVNYLYGFYSHIMKCVSKPHPDR